jgi:hypothetical protein
MKINDEHFFHGAALMQVAEDDNFTAINPLILNGTKSHIAFVVNADIAVYPKYAGKARGTHKEYQFTFKPENVEELGRLADRYPKTFVTLVCVAARGVCCLRFSEFITIYDLWQGEIEDGQRQFPLLVTAPKGREFRVYANAPGTRNRMLGGALLRARSDFPTILFE